MVEIEMAGKEIAIIDHVGLKAGMECYDLELSSAFKRSDISCTVYTNFSDQGASAIPTFRFRMKENIFSRLDMVIVYIRLAFAIRKKQVFGTVLHSFRFGFVEWLFIRILALSGSRLCLIVHDPESLIGMKAGNFWKSGILNSAEALVVHNSFSRDSLLVGMSGDISRKVHIIPHGNFISTMKSGSSVEQFRMENGLGTGRKYILFFGQIKETKGLDVLLEAFARTNREAVLIIAGRMRGHSFEKYEQLIEQHNLKENVKVFGGYITPEKRNMLFHIADVVVLPYRKVFQSGVMLMAMSCGKAVIASDLLPNMEMIKKNSNGFLFKSGNADELAELLNEVMKDDHGRERVAKEGFRYVQENLNWDVIVKDWIKLFQL